MGLLVVNPGAYTTVQDRGRPGYAAWGVSAGGAFDRASAELANALLGNPPDCALLEMTLLGGTYQAQCPLALALSGAPLDARVLHADHSQHPLAIPSSFSMLAGDRLVLGSTISGARTYLAVKGGWQTTPILGSRSSELPLRAGTHLPAAATSASTLSRHVATPPWQAPESQPFRIVAGPDARLYPELSVSFWEGRKLRVGRNHDRTGLRLEGEPISLLSDPERLSTPVAPGAVQLAGGQLIVLGVACGTMGGYPHVAQIISADLDRLGQLKSGDAIEFECVTVETARTLSHAARAAHRSLVLRLATLAQDQPSR